jgi:fatty acid desaturase
MPSGSPGALIKPQTKPTPPTRPTPHAVWALCIPLVHAGLITSCAVVYLEIDHAWKWAPIAVLIGLTAWMNHVALTQLHEAAHGALSKHRLVNEIQGVLIGTLALTPLSIYRYVHARHHAHLGRERDPEFWPYNLPGSPRALRVGYALLELTVGWLFTPALYSVRSALSWSSIPARHRPRILLEWGVLVTAWAAILWVITVNAWWPVATVSFFAPAWLAGVLQTVRKFIEHLGMHGETIASMTRTVVYQRPVGKLASASQLHVDHHGTHHRHARIPYFDLPEHTPAVYGRERLFRSHLEACLDMLPHLLDPKVGPQWLRPAENEPQAQAKV